MKKKLSLIISLIFIFFSCEKELDINDFSDDFSFYEPELRIEAIIYPSQNTALVRVDKSIRIDEADLFDCIDNDLDWNYYYCVENNQSFESSDECIDRLKPLSILLKILHSYELISLFELMKQIYLIVLTMT